MNAMTAAAELLDHNWQIREAADVDAGVQSEPKNARVRDRDAVDHELCAWAARARAANGFGG